MNPWHPAPGCLGQKHPGGEMFLGLNLRGRGVMDSLVIALIDITPPWTQTMSWYSMTKFEFMGVKNWWIFKIYRTGFFETSSWGGGNFKSPSTVILTLIFGGCSAQAPQRAIPAWEKLSDLAPIPRSQNIWIWVNQKIGIYSPPPDNTWSRSFKAFYITVAKSQHALRRKNHFGTNFQAQKQLF